MKFTCEHISANCNPMPTAFDFLTDNTIVYCYKNQVGIYDLTEKIVFRNIHPQKQPYPNRANCIKTFEVKGKFYIVVGYDSGDLVVYASTDKIEWVEEQWIKQKNSILSLNLYEGYLAVNNNDALITIYRLQQTENQSVKLSTLQQVQFPLNKTIETVALHQFENKLVIFMGGVDQLIHCYSKNLSNQQEELSYHFSLTGHQNAITKLALDREGQSLLLASSSKDGYIRLWKVTQNRDEAKFHKNVKTLKVSEKTQFCVFLDSVLISHECSVTNLHWTRFNQQRQLTSASLDCTLCIWSQAEDNSWSVESRMGQFLGNKNAYFQVLSNRGGTLLAALNFIGSVLIWNYDKQTNKFNLRESFNGHYNQVKDIAWNYSGDYLVSVSKDQTTRVLAQHHKTRRYHEISRAQIHGYDINTVCLIKTKDQTFDLIACGADEKVVRIFEPPACFANYFNSFTHKNFHLFFNSPEEEEKYLLKRQSNQSPLLYQTYTQGGQQVLGLMTKMQRVERQKVVDYYNEDDEEAVNVEEEKIDLKETKKIDFSVPPHDDYLVKHTLWPEMNKLYGHPHELEYVCKSHDSKLMASSCNGLSKQASSIIIWNTETWKIHKILSHHNYTVYSMQFSSTGKYFASVSKDRKLAVFNDSFDLVFSYEAHARAITCVSISQDERWIVTGSRDKTIKIHSIEEKKSVAEHQFKCAVTAVAFCKVQGHFNVICCGLIDGSLILLEWDREKGFSIKGQVESKYSHTEKVNAIRWNGKKFATCSDDHSVAIFNIQDW